jgi:hypothetical protein
MAIKEYKSHGEAGSADPKVVEMERRHIQELIKEGGHNLRDIFNMDETGLFYACVAVTDLQGPPSERTQMEKIRDLKSLCHGYDGKDP